MKYGLMGLVALALVVGGYFMLNKADEVSSTKDNAAKVKNELVNSDANKDLNAAVKSLGNKTKPLIDAAASSALTSMVFEEMEWDYGNINQDSENEHLFKFTNTGSEPLIISKAKGSCGCTVPKYPTGPIMPGETEVIQVVYKPGKQKDKQTKTITLTANTEPTTTVLRITAVVSPVEG